MDVVSEPLFGSGWVSAGATLDQACARDFCALICLSGVKSTCSVQAANGAPVRLEMERRREVKKWLVRWLASRCPSVLEERSSARVVLELRVAGALLYLRCLA